MSRAIFLSWVFLITALTFDTALAQTNAHEDGRAGSAVAGGARELGAGGARNAAPGRRAGAWRASLFAAARAWSALRLGGARRPRRRLAPPAPEDAARGSELGFCRGAA